MIKHVIAVGGGGCREVESIEENIKKCTECFTNFMHHEVVVYWFDVGEKGKTFAKR